MYARTTLVEIDTVRTSMQQALQLFKEQVLPGLQRQDGYLGVFVFTTPEGRGMGTFATGALERHLMLFRAPPGRETYEVVLAEALAELAGVRARA